MKQIHFFLTKSDLIEILKVIYERYPFVVSFLDRKSDTVQRYEFLDEIPNWGIAIEGNSIIEQSYYLIKPGEVPKYKDIELRKGGTMRLYEQGTQPDSIYLRTGGVMKSENIIISGNARQTVSKDQYFIEMYKLLISTIKKQCIRVHSFYVGKEANRLFDDRFRLTSSIGSPKECDLSKL